MANSVDPDRTAPIGAVCCGSKLFASILNSSVMLGNYLQQTTRADDILRCIFFLDTNSCVLKSVVTVGPHLANYLNPRTDLPLHQTIKLFELVRANYTKTL